jgi:hypothetical protein
MISDAMEGLHYSGMDLFGIVRVLFRITAVGDDAD